MLSTYPVREEGLKPYFVGNHVGAGLTLCDSEVRPRRPAIQAPNRRQGTPAAGAVPRGWEPGQQRPRNQSARPAPPVGLRSQRTQGRGLGVGFRTHGVSVNGSAWRRAAGPC